VDVVVLSHVCSECNKCRLFLKNFFFSGDGMARRHLLRNPTATSGILWTHGNYLSFTTHSKLGRPPRGHCSKWRKIASLLGDLIWIGFMLCRQPSENIYASTTAPSEVIKLVMQTGAQAKYSLHEAAKHDETTTQQSSKVQGETKECKCM